MSWEWSKLLGRCRRVPGSVEVTKGRLHMPPSLQENRGNLEVRLMAAIKLLATPPKRVSNRGAIFSPLLNTGVVLLNARTVTMALPAMIAGEARKHAPSLVPQSTSVSAVKGTLSLCLHQHNDINRQVYAAVSLTLSKIPTARPALRSELTSLSISQSLVANPLKKGSPHKLKFAIEAN